MKKVITLLIVVIVSIQWTFSEKFNSIVLSNKYVCLPFVEMDKLIVSHKLVPELKSNLKDYSNKVYILSNENIYLKNNIPKTEHPIIKKIKFGAVIVSIIGAFIGGVRLGAEF